MDGPLPQRVAGQPNLSRGVRHNATGSLDPPFRSDVERAHIRACGVHDSENRPDAEFEVTRVARTLYCRALQAGRRAGKGLGARQPTAQQVGTGRSPQPIAADDISLATCWATSTALQRTVCLLTLIVAI